jgi:hypothetical protein
MPKTPAFPLFPLCAEKCGEGDSTICRLKSIDGSICAWLFRSFNMEASSSIGYSGRLSFTNFLARMPVAFAVESMNFQLRSWRVRFLMACVCCGQGLYFPSKRGAECGLYPVY